MTNTPTTPTTPTTPNTPVTTTAEFVSRFMDDKAFMREVLENCPDYVWEDRGPDAEAVSREVWLDGAVEAAGRMGLHVERGSLMIEVNRQVSERSKLFKVRFMARAMRVASQVAREKGVR
jgi:hypothetical protein